MQIYYCDACGLRVNNSELVPTGDKVFCSACAQKQPTLELPAAKRTPSGGTGTVPRPSPFGSGEVHAARQTGGHDVKPRTGHTAAVARPASNSARGTGGGKAKDTSTLLYAGAGAAVMLLVVILIFSGSKELEKGKTATEAKNPPVDAPAKKDTPPPAKTTSTEPIAAKQVEPVKPPPTDPGFDDIRENMARREFVNAQQAARAAGGNIVAARRAYLDFIRRYRSTKAGQEAIAQYEAMAKTGTRAADNPGSTIPGLKVEIYDRGSVGDRIRGANHSGLKKLSEKTIDRVSLGDRGQVGGAFGREEALIAVFTGFVEVPADGEYTFYTNSDDASLLYVGDWLIIDNDDHHAVREVGETIPLTKGKHRIRLEYSQGGGLAECHLSISGPNLSKQIVPPNMLSRIP